MAQPPKPIVFDDLRGGRNDTDPPLKLPMNQAVEFLNMDWKDATFGRKRGGAISVALTGGSTFASGISTLARHVPGSDETAAELWGIDGAPLFKRLTGGTAWADVTGTDVPTTRFQDVEGVSLNGKFFVAYDTAVDRMHAYDPLLSSPTLRRMGLVVPAAPTVANTVPAGTYAAVIGYWRVRWIQVSGSTLVRRSEPSASTSFTPSGTKDGVVITRPTAAGEGETHWEIEVSTDNATFFAVFAFHNAGSQIAIATTTGTLNAAVSAVVAAGILVDPAGYHSLFPSVKHLLTDGNRLLGAGAWESAGAQSGGKNSRIWFTPVLGSADKGDDERIMLTTQQKNYVDINENDGGGVTGLGGPINGIPFAFKYRQIWKLRPTGDVTTPYLPRKIIDGVGCIAHKSIAIGEDQTGRAALYFMSHRGPYRVNFDGAIEYLGRDNEATWRTINLAATSVVTHSTYYPDLHQWWVWIATGSANDPDVKMMFDVQRGFPDENGQIRGGWAKHTGDSAGARCSCLFANTLGASMSKDLKPHIGRSTGTTIFKCDTTDTDDNATDFQAYATTRPVQTTPDLLRKVGIAESTLVAKAGAAQTVTVTINRDFGKETRAASVLLTAAGSETRVVKKVEGSEMGEADVIQMTVGDSAASDAVWTIDALVTPVIVQEVR